MASLLTRFVTPSRLGGLDAAGLVLLRGGLGGYFALAGLAKARGELANGFGSFRNSDGFLALQPAWLPDLLATPYGLVLPWVEIVVGLSLALGLFTRLSALVTLGMLASFTIVLVSASGLSGGSPGPFHPNFLMIFGAVVFMGRGGGRLSLDRVLARTGTRAAPGVPNGAPGGARPSAAASPTL
ncbi:MAG: DoxX family protein [Planctomycetota bacterium]